MAGAPDEPSRTETSVPSNTARYRTRFDPDGDDSLITAVVTAVATATDRGPFDIEPLYTRIDPDALEAIFSPSPSGAMRTGTVSFPICDVVVTITDGERILVEPKTSGDDE